MGSISFATFEAIIKRCNKNLRMFPSKSTRSSMIYLYRPNHPDASEYGLLELCGFPSPNFFFSFPKYDFLDHTQQLQRGWNTVLKILASKKLIRKDMVRAILPDAFAQAQGKPTGKKAEDERKKTVPFYSSPVKATKVQVRRNLKTGKHSLKVIGDEIQKRSSKLYFT